MKRLYEPRVLANVVFPAFYLPWVVAIFAWPAAVIGFAAEVLILRWLLRPDSTKALILWFVLANAVSSTAGFLIAGLLPSGFDPAGVMAEPGANFARYAMLSWPLWYALSVVAEFPFYLGRWSTATRVRRLLAVTLGNLASYTILAIGGSF
jgi:hypothetical protein